ncbi:MAG TPA: alanine racemase [Tepidisphaeraceae bacterium]|jgi:alanine racemase
MLPNSVLQIDLTRLAENVQQICRFLQPQSRLCAVVKANAYGLGAAVIAPELQRIGVEWFAVYDPWQAEEILQAGITGNVLIFMPVTDVEHGSKLANAANAGRIHFALHSAEQMEALNQTAQKLGTRLPVHVEIDTGMSRGGQVGGAAADLIAGLKSQPNLRLAGVFSHPSCAESDHAVTQKQLAGLQAIGNEDGVIHHFSNTWAAISDQKNQLNMVRVGLGLWGYPSAGNWSVAEKNRVRLKPIAKWVSRIAHLKSVPSGSPVGYGQTFHTKRETRIGIVPVGYADGYPLLLSNRGVVRIGEKKIDAPVIGRVNMDQIILDLTDIADAKIGDEAELISDDSAALNAIEKLAALAQSHPYEMLCRITPRVPREYLR